MNRFIILILVFWIGKPILYSQKKCDIVNEYAKIFSAKKVKYKNGKTYLKRQVQTLDKKSCFANFINNHELYIKYLLRHFSDNSHKEYLLSIQDSVKLNHKFISFLKKDTLFNKEMNKLAQAIVNKPGFVRDTVTMDDLLDIAVKFFYINRVTDKYYYGGQVCIGKNGIKQTEKIRKPHIEAFSYEIVLSNYNNETYNLHDEFVNGIKELYHLNLGIDKQENMLRAQGAMYLYMRHNQTLKNILLNEYDKNKNFLPFVLKN